MIRRFVVGYGAAVLMLIVTTASGAAEKVLFNFKGRHGQYPLAGLIADSQGNLYGTTTYGGGYSCGGTYACGTVFKVTGHGKETVLYSFTGGSNGYWPYAGLLMDAQGDLYGTTFFGGDSNCFSAYGCGVVFEVTPQGKETVLHAFAGINDGAYPRAGLIADTQGNLYGTTSNGGNFTNCGYGCGTVFEMSQAGVKLLYTFSGAGDGSEPFAGLVMDAQGNLYGTTDVGGSAGCGGTGCGTVFEVTPNGTETVLHAFKGGSDGFYPQAGLIADSEGNFYGTTASGGNSGSGTVFKVTPQGTETVLYSFKGGNDGREPEGALVTDSEANFYGTTTYGGAFYAGTVFKLSPQGREKVLYSFFGDNGTYPADGLLLGAQGHLYGTTGQGGTGCSTISVYSCGTVFEITKTE